MKQAPALNSWAGVWVVATMLISPCIAVSSGVPRLGLVRRVSGMLGGAVLLVAAGRVSGVVGLR